MAFPEFTKSPVGVCEFTETTTRVIFPLFTRDGAIEVLGYGEEATDGFRDGRFTNLSDAAECVWNAASAARRQAGVKFSDLAVNLDDPFLQSVRVSGSSELNKGEEGFGQKHMEEAYARALCSVNPSEKHLVYEGVAQFIVDGEEYASYPAGVLGKEFTVVLEVLFSESQQVQNLRSVVARAGFNVKGIFPTAWAALNGIHREGPAYFSGALLAAGSKICHVVSSSGGAIRSHRSLLLGNGYDDGKMDEIASIVRSFGGGGDEGVVVAGDVADDAAFQRRLTEKLKKPVRNPGSGFRGPHHQSARFACLAGLAGLSQSIKAPKGFAGLNSDVIRTIKMRAKSFVQDYF